MSDTMTVALDEDAIWAAIDRERLELADLLDDLSDQEWDHRSLCTDWRVGDVAAHLALAQMGRAQAAVGLLRAAGNIDRMVRDTARRHAVTPRGVLTGQIRAMVGSRRRPPGVTPMEPLIDVLVHGQDITIPVGRVRSMPIDAATAAATRAWTLPWPLSASFRARARLRGLELLATDTDWSVGRGARVAGPIDALLLLLTGRTAAIGRLSGPGTDRLPGRR